MIAPRFTQIEWDMLDQQIDDLRIIRTKHGDEWADLVIDAITSPEEEAEIARQLSELAPGCEEWATYRVRDGVVEIIGDAV